MLSLLQILDSNETPNNHLGPIWEIKWIEREHHAGRKPFSSSYPFVIQRNDLILFEAQTNDFETSRQGQLLMTRQAIILIILITGEDRSENIITTSTDGRVAQWMIRKGFESIGKKTYFEAKITHFNNFKLN